MLIAGAVLELVPAEFLSSLLGQQAGFRGVISGLMIGTLLPACPFITYPLVGTLYNSGAGFASSMAMLFGSGLIFACYLTNDLTHFNLKILSLRVGFSLTAATIATTLLYFSGYSG